VVVRIESLPERDDETEWGVYVDDLLKALAMAEAPGFFARRYIPAPETTDQKGGER
jgi:hypothetical protein